MSALRNTLRPLVTRLSILVLALAIVLGAPARAAGDPIVEGVAVEGNRRVEADAIRAAISTKPGQPLEARKLDADVKSVMKLGFFSDVVVEARGEPDRPT